MKNHEIQTPVSTRLALFALGVALFAVGCEAPTSADLDEHDNPELAKTIVLGGPGGPVAKSSQVAWATAGRPTQGFSGDFARAQFLMSSLADLAYKDGNELRTEVSALGFSIAQTVEGLSAGPAAGDVDAFVARSLQNDMNVIAIRGSAELEDFLTDLSNIPTLSVTGWPSSFTLHAGFATYANKVYAEVRSAVEDSCTGARKPLWLTGHSLGGASATIVAYKLRSQGCNVQGVSTFGSPRAGLKDWQQAYQQLGLNAITQRWVYKQDPVTCLPPGGGWRHVGTLNRIDGGVSLNVQESNLVCNPDGLIGGLRTAAAVAHFPVALSGAVSDWLNGLFELTLFCSDDTKWDDVVSLGGCTVLENGSRVLASYHFTAEEFLLAVIGAIANVGDHASTNYTSGMGKVDFPTPPPVQVAVVHVVLQGPPSILQQMIDKTIPIIESQQNSLCVAERAANGEVFCDFRVADGYTARIEINNNDLRSLNPPQTIEYGNAGGGPNGCTRVVEGRSGSSLVSCEREIRGNATIVVKFANYVELL